MAVVVPMAVVQGLAVALDPAPGQADLECIDSLGMSFDTRARRCSSMNDKYGAGQDSGLVFVRLECTRNSTCCRCRKPASSPSVRIHYSRSLDTRAVALGR